MTILRDRSHSAAQRACPSRLASLVSTFAAACISFASARADAQVGEGVAAAWEFIDAALTVKDQAESIFGEGPDLAAAIAHAEDAIVAEIERAQGEDLGAKVRSALEKYQDILNNPGIDHSDEIEFLTGRSSSYDARDILNSIEDLITNRQNATAADLAYSLAGPFNALTMVSAHAYALHDAMNPNDPPTSYWNWNELYSRAMRVNYALVGAVTVLCSYEQENPGHDASNPEWANMQDEEDTFTHSLLWELKFGDHDVEVGSATVNIYSYSNPDIFPWEEQVKIYSNPGRHTQRIENPIDYSSYISSQNYSGKPYNLRIAGAQKLSGAQAFAAGAFAATDSLLDTWMNDPVVSGMRNVMRTLLYNNNGGDALDHNFGLGDSPDLAGDVSNGDRLDARVLEPSCPSGGPGGPGLAYAVNP